MILDFFAGTGAWPFRKLEHASPGALATLLRREGVDRAAVYPISSILAKDCMEGNREVAEAAKAHPSAFVPFACINPAFPGWKADFETCFETMGMMGLRLFPTYHGYGLEDSCFAEIVSKAGEKRIPVALAVRVEDERQHHPLLMVPSLDMLAATGAVLAFPETRFVLSGATLPELLSVREALAEAGNWSFDTGRMQGRHDLQGTVEVLMSAVEAFGAGRILFGSNAPFQYVQSALMKILRAPLDESDKEAILSGNALRLLGDTAD
jgi:predicted TIM-barrel fold metal-dependent hydrolase